LGVAGCADGFPDEPHAASVTASAAAGSASSIRGWRLSAVCRISELLIVSRWCLAPVARLKRHKDEHGIAFVDPNREAQMIADRLRENAGPLSEDGLRAFYRELLALIKREV